MQRIFLAAAALTALAACTAEDAAPPAAETPATGTPAAEAPPASNEPEPDAPVLTALQPGDADGLEGELACSFTASGESRPMLAARSFAGGDFPVQAAVRTADGVVMLDGGTGGFGSILEGGAYSGGGVTARVATQGDDTAAHEGSVYMATLDASTPAGDAAWDGEWSCGP